MTPEQAEKEHAPVNWFLPATFPSCSCGYDPKKNSQLIGHWRELGIRWYDDHGTLRVEVAP